MGSALCGGGREDGGVQTEKGVEPAFDLVAQAISNGLFEFNFAETPCLEGGGRCTRSGLRRLGARPSAIIARSSVLR